MKAYLDNNVVSAIARDDTQAESNAIRSLRMAYVDGKIELVTSELTFDEIKKYHGSDRAKVERVFRDLEKVPIARWDELVGMNVHIDRYTLINSPIIQNDPMYEALRALGLGVVDARHIFVATKQSCGYFLTCDKGILRRAAKIKALCGVDAQKPSDFVTAQGW
jgi:hypothetical protein